MAGDVDDGGDAVSFARDIRPVLQSKCFGCHQPNQAGGGLDLTRYENLLLPADSGQAALVVGQAQASAILQLVSTENGPPAMPPTGDPLTAQEQDRLRRWIDQGAKNDWVATYEVPSAERPPVYRGTPPITAVDVAGSGQWIAVSGIHEVLLLDPETREIGHRLIGLSPRIESVRFSPDSTSLAVAGGRPGEFGELQVWDCETGRLRWSRTITGDVIRGISWAPNGSQVAVGCTDTSVRAFDAQTAQQVLFQNVSEDWVHDTTYSVDGSHLVSVGRDRTCKLTEVATERFVDNITSITPGILQGGIAAVARHPERDEVLLGGADGVPKLYRIHRLTTRVIGDDANLIRRFPTMEGRIQAVAIAADGKRLAVGSSARGRGVLRVYAYDFDTSLPADLAPLLVKVVGTRSPEEERRIEDYVTSGIQLLTEQQFPAGVYAVQFDQQQDAVWCGTADGALSKIDVAAGSIAWSGSPVESLLDRAGRVASAGQWQVTDGKASEPGEAVAGEAVAGEAVAGHSVASEPIFAGTPPRIQGLRVFPPRVALPSAAEYVQFVVMGQTDDGGWVDVTRWATFSGRGLEVNASGLGQVSRAPVADPPGTAATVVVQCLGQEVALPLEVVAAEPEVQFVRDVQPMLTRLGCNAGTCHGAADGKNGFKLSLRGYDAAFDLQSLTDELWMRRVNVAEPVASLMLQKATAAVPHQGGQLIEADSKAYGLLHQWIAQGAALETAPVRTIRLELEPELPILPRPSDRQQVRVVAHYSDGSSRDVTRDAFVEVGDMEIARVSRTGQVTAVRRGETPVMARYDGCYAATTLTVMGDRTGFQWEAPPSFNRIDDFVSDKWQRMKIQPAPLCSDHEFIRRVTLDLTGLPPTPEAVRAFVADSRPTREKRDALVEQLLADPSYVDYWTNKWADLLQVNSKFLGREGAAAFHGWIRQQVADNVPYDQFVHKILTATGSNRENPAASYFKILRQPDLIMENTTHLFLATRFNCNKCHDHPFERWTQDQYFQTAAYFARVGLSEDPASEGRRIGGSAVEGATPLYENLVDLDAGEMIHERTRAMVAPRFPFAGRTAVPQADRTADSDPIESTEVARRQQFAEWLTAPENPYFATSYVNRVWGYLLGTGLIEPLDDIRASNPASNPELLAFLESYFIESGMDTRKLMALICQSRVYQLSVQSNPFNADDQLNYSRAKPKRLPAEVLFDAMHAAVGAGLNIPGVPPGTRAAQLVDVAQNVPSGFLATLGRPVRESACECERSDELQLGAVLAMVSGPDVARLIADPANKITQLARDTGLSDAQMIDEIYLHILNRPATANEIAAVGQHTAEIAASHLLLQEAVSQREAWWGAERDRLAQQREAAIQSARDALQAFVDQHDPGLAGREQQRAQELARLTAEMADYSGREGEEFARWRRDQLSGQHWSSVLPFHLQASSDSRLTALPDRSLRATLGKGSVETTLYFAAALPVVTGIRLEALADPELPGGGPGLAPNGNFVVSEWIIEYALAGAPDQWQTAKVASSQADFHQGGFSTDKLFNGVVDNNSDGWAVHPATGQTHWVVARFDQPIELPPGSQWRIRLVQNYSDGLHMLGRFRIAFTGSREAWGLGLAEPLLADLLNLPFDDAAAGLAAAPEALLQAFRQGDPRRQELQRQLTEAQRPLDLLPGIVERRLALEVAQRPIPEDRVLQQLRADLAASQAQLEESRLTLAQDLTWALINSPGFLFNH
jgi:WD40 repeat protein